MRQFSVPGAQLGARSPSAALGEPSREAREVGGAAQLISNTSSFTQGEETACLLTTEATRMAGCIKVLSASGDCCHHGNQPLVSAFFFSFTKPSCSSPSRCFPAFGLLHPSHICFTPLTRPLLFILTQPAHEKALFSQTFHPHH